MTGHIDYVDLRASRREQGLPERLEDPEAVDRVVAVLLATDSGDLLPHRGEAVVRDAA